MHYVWYTAVLNRLSFKHYLIELIDRLRKIIKGLQNFVQKSHYLEGNFHLRQIHGMISLYLTHPSTIFSSALQIFTANNKACIRQRSSI